MRENCEGLHITKDETFAAANSMYETLRQVCPGCSMGVLGVIMSMLAGYYLKQLAENGEIFDYNDWIECIAKASKKSVKHFEKKGATIQ